MSARLVADQRFEQAMGYLSPADLGMNAVVIPPLGTVSTAPIYSPGLNAFNGIFTASTNALLSYRFLDPLTQADVLGVGVAVSAALNSPGPTWVLFGNNTFLATGFIWCLWSLEVTDLDGVPNTVSVQLYTNARRLGRN
jgi:hypothetical protein